MSLSAGILFGLIAMLGWGFSDFFAKRIVNKTGALRLAFWTQAISVLLMSLLLFFVEVPSFSRNTILLLLAAGVLSAIGLLAFYRGLSVGRVSIVSPVSAGYPLIVVLLSVLFLSEKLSSFQAGGIALLILGTVAVSFERKRIRIKGNKEILLALTAFLCWGLLIFFVGLLVKQIGWFFPIYLVGLITITFLVAFAVSARKSVSFPKSSLSSVLSIALLEVIAPLCLGAGFAFGMVSVVSPLSGAYPAVTVLLAIAVLKERILRHQKLAILGILAGLVLVSL